MLRQLNGGVRDHDLILKRVGHSQRSKIRDLTVAQAKVVDLHQLAQNVVGNTRGCGKTGHMMRDCPIRLENTNRPAASIAGSASVTRANIKANTRKETLRQGRVFALVPGDVQNTKSVVSGFGCDTEAVINIIAHRDTTQRALIQYEYKAMYSEDLLK
ncbi:hypothetical protein ACSBR2_015826 [Camellia fascicularis]